MRRLVIAFLLLSLAGCTIPTGPSASGSNIGYPWGPANFYLDRSLLPLAYYDGLFDAVERELDYTDTSGVDRSSFFQTGSITFYNKLGSEIEGPISDSISIDGIPVRFHGYYDFDSVFHFPSPVIWIFSGDNYFPAFSHSIASEVPVTITAPLQSDTQSASHGFTISYSAPGIDNVSISLSYLGLGTYKSDTTGSLQDAGDFEIMSVPNSGSFTVPPYSIYDTSQLRSFIPKSLEVIIAWGRGDTVHVAGKIFGFTTEVVCSREFNLKP